MVAYNHRARPPHGPGSVAAADYDERTPLHVACARDQVDCSLILLLQAADVEYQSLYGKSFYLGSD